MNKHFKHFFGKEVMISTDMLVQDTTSTDMGSQTVSYPLFYEGILLDIDEDNYYLGDNYSTPTHIVSRRKFLHMMLKPEIDLNKETLELLQIPKKPEEIN